MPTKASIPVCTVDDVFNRRFNDGPHRLKQRTYDTPDGQQRTVTEIDVDDIGPSLRYATATVTRTRKTTTTVGAGGDDQPPF